MSRSVVLVLGLAFLLAGCCGQYHPNGEVITGPLVQKSINVAHQMVTVGPRFGCSDLVRVQRYLLDGEVGQLDYVQSVGVKADEYSNDCVITLDSQRMRFWSPQTFCRVLTKALLQVTGLDPLEMTMDGTSKRIASACSET